MIDFHSHILPCIDDGAKNPEKSAEMVKQALAQGVDTIVATPHFNIDEIDIEKFLEKRSDSIRMLQEAVEQAGVSQPEIIPGAEVYLLPGTADTEDIHRLCIEGTNCMLVEMPIGRWTGWVFNEIYKLRQRDIVPILAHLERYVSDKENIEKVIRLLDMEVCVQINADDVSAFKYRKIIKHFAGNCEMIVLGSDSHDPEKRPSRIGKACKVLEKKFGERFVKNLNTNARILLYTDFSF